MLQSLEDLVLLIAGLTAAVEIGRGARRWYGRHIEPGRAAEEKLLRLAANVRIEYFVDLLGVPPFERRNGPHTELVFVDDLFFVQAWVDSDGRVLAFSVTTRSSHFNPQVPFPGGGQYLGPDGPTMRAQLLVTSFDEVVGDPSWIEADLGARRYWYREHYYLANPGNYQSVTLSLSDAGALRSDVPLTLPEAVQPAGTMRWENDLPPELSIVRRQSPNTYTVTAPYESLADRGPEWLGADLDDVRVFAPAMDAPQPRAAQLILRLLDWRSPTGRRTGG